MSVECTFACVGVWVYGCMGVWVCGCMGVWVYGCVGVWVYGCVGVWVYGAFDGQCKVCAQAMQSLCSGQATCHRTSTASSDDQYSCMHTLCTPYDMPYAHPMHSHLHPPVTFKYSLPVQVGLVAWQLRFNGYVMAVGMQRIRGGGLGSKCREGKGQGWLGEQVQRGGRDKGGLDSSAERGRDKGGS
jgi:hypothetical protein